MASRKESTYQAGETKIYGISACLAVFKKRSHDIVKVYLAESRLKTLSDLIRFCVAQRKAYKVVATEELEKITESIHHEGVCLIAKEAKTLRFDDLLIKLKSEQKPSCLLYLDGVEKPHNVGNILRAAAHFGVTALITAQKEFATLPPSARRVSEGGSEFVPVVLVRDPVSDLSKLKNIGFEVFATSSHAKKSIYQIKIPNRSVWILGSEVRGISPALQKLATHTVLIPGTNAVESLNIASAAAILMSEFYRAF